VVASLGLKTGRGKRLSRRCTKVKKVSGGARCLVHWVLEIVSNVMSWNI